MFFEELIQAITGGLKSNQEKFSSVHKYVEDNFKKDDKLILSIEAAKAFEKLLNDYLVQYEGHKLLLVGELLFGRDFKFEGELEILNSISYGGFVKALFNGVKVQMESKENVDPVDNIEEGDIVMYGAIYAYVQTINKDEGTFDIWHNEGMVGEVPLSHLKLVTEEKEKQIAEILINWNLGLRIDTYDSENSLTAELMIVQGDSEVEYKLMNMETYSIVEESNTVSPYNIAWFIVNNLEPYSLEVL